MIVDAKWELTLFSATAIDPSHFIFLFYIFLNTHTRHQSTRPLSQCVLRNALMALWEPVSGALWACPPPTPTLGGHQKEKRLPPAFPALACHIGSIHACDQPERALSLRRTHPSSAFSSYTVSRRIIDYPPSPVSLIHPLLVESPFSLYDQSSPSLGCFPRSDSSSLLIGPVLRTSLCTTRGLFPPPHPLPQYSSVHDIFPSA